MNPSKVMFALCLWVPGIALGSDIYRCQPPGGTPTFQQVPCSGDGALVELPEPAARWEPLRPGEQSLLDQHEARQQRRQRAPKSSRRQPARAASDRACWEKRRRLDAVAAKLRRGYKPAQGERLRRRRDNLGDFVNRYCD